MIHKYQQWLEESEKVDAAPEVAPAETTDPTADPTNPAAALPEAPSDETPASTEAPASTDSAENEIEEYKKLDTERRDAIKAFKAKQEEFLEIPEDVRKNPVEEEDKTKVEGLKTELIDLNKKMKDAIKAWDSFNSKALGLAGEDDEESEDFEP